LSFKRYARLKQRETSLFKVTCDVSRDKNGVLYGREMEE
jgi:hypothetical protein